MSKAWFTVPTLQTGADSGFCSLTSWGPPTAGELQARPASETETLFIKFQAHNALRKGSSPLRK